MKKQDLEITGLEKQLWNAMRKDLYRVAPLPPEAIKFVGPRRKTLRALEIWGKNRALLGREEIFTLEALNKMDVDRLSQDAGIPHKELDELMSMVIRELLLMRELEETK